MEMQRWTDASWCRRGARDLMQMQTLAAPVRQAAEEAGGLAVAEAAAAHLHLCH
jgi:hypothetical protein